MCAREQERGRRQGLQSVRRRGEKSWVVLARATPEPGGNRNPPETEIKTATLFGQEGKEVKLVQN